MGFKEFLHDLVNPEPWLSVTIENNESGKSITLYHHQADPADVKQSLNEILNGALNEPHSAITISIGEAKWLSDQLRRSGNE